MERRRGGAGAHRGRGRPRIPPAAALTAEWLGQRLAGAAHDLDAVVPPAALEPLARYAGLVLESGTRINLTGARTPDAVADHLADALALLAHLPADPFRYVDVGSGAGFPGLVIGVLRPDASGVLLEPTRKKQLFLAHAIRSLGLAGRLDARAERLEQHLASGNEGAYDLAVARAVWPAAQWVEIGLPLLKPGGVILGLEGAPTGPLPDGAERHPYRLGERSRSVVHRRR